MGDEFFWNIISYIKIDSLVFHLLGAEENQQNALLFFRELSTHSECEDLPLFHSNIFYIQLGDVVSQVLIPLQTNAIAIAIVINLISFANMKIFRKLN